MQPGADVIDRLLLAVLLAGLLPIGCRRAPGDKPVPESTSPFAGSESAEQQRAWDASVGGAPQVSAFLERRAEREALVRSLAAEDIRDPAVLAAMSKVPRHAFVLRAFSLAAYADRALPIVGGQTISQPFVVATMTEAARVTPRSNCLEIGTGSGYQAAILAELCAHTYSIEYLPEVALFGEANLRGLGYGPDRVSLRVGDGYVGWPDAAPFDVILVTAAPEKMPEPLVRQLAVGGRLVAPVGPQDDVQELVRWTRLREGDDPEALRKETLLAVRFVPFAGQHGR